MEYRSQRIENRADRGVTAGGWWPLPMQGERASAVFYCPHCNKPIALVRHRIDDYGQVDRFVECYGCEFRQVVVLLGWADGH